MMNRWKIEKIGKIIWDVKQDKALPHEDHIEMSGQRCSLWVRYGVTENGQLMLEQTVMYPGLRTIPNNTHASLRWDCGSALMGKISLKDVEETELVSEICFDGILTIRSEIGDLHVTRKLLPSRERAYTIQEVTVRNAGSADCVIGWDKASVRAYRRGCHGVYLLERYVTAAAPEHVGEDKQLSEDGYGVLKPGQAWKLQYHYVGRVVTEEPSLLAAEEEIGLRSAFVQELGDNLVLVTGDPVMDNAFCLAKLRAAESVFRTRGGLMHSPGGLSYYGAVWTNDQAEYAGPFFPYLGEQNAIEASRNAYDLYLPFMGENYYRIPSSVIAEGTDIWEGAGDRGDAAMYAYGASRFALEMGDAEYAARIWKGISWCLEYCRRQLTEEGVVASDSDELENRFPSGSANLSTSSLTYAALENAAKLADSLGMAEQAETYRREAVSLRGAIEKYFGARVEGYNTYRYYEGNKKLRSWICLPLVFGIEERKEETVKALFSENLWMSDGLATESGDTVFWDRSTLYALRGVFHAGEKEKAYDYLYKYSLRRTLGEHVPYPVEAWPEGNQRHLSAESALYCRIFTEGILGLEAAGLQKVRIRPQLPAAWKQVALKQVHLCGKVFDLLAAKRETGYHLQLCCDGRLWEQDVKEGEEVFFEEAFQ